MTRRRIPKSLVARHRLALRLLEQLVAWRPDIGTPENPGTPGTPSFAIQRARELLAAEKP